MSRPAASQATGPAAGETRPARWWWYAAKIVVAAAGIVLIVITVDAEAVRDALGRADVGTLALAFAVSHAAVAVFSLRTRQVFRAFGAPISAGASYRMYLQSLFYAVFVPTPISAEAVKYAKAGALVPHCSRRRRVAIILVDRVIGLATFVGLAVIGYALVRDTVRLPFAPVVAVVAGGVALAAAIVAGVLVGPRLARAVQEATGAGHLAGAVVVSVGMQLGMAASALLVARAFGIELTYLQVVYALCGSMCFQAVPLSVLGAGGGEAAGVVFYLSLGLDRTAILLLVGAVYGFRVVNGLLGGVWEMVDGAARVKRV